MLGATASSPVSPPKSWDLHVWSTSHLSFLDENKAENPVEARRKFSELLPGASSIDARKGMIFLETEYPKIGLIPLPFKQRHRFEQVHKASNFLYRHPAKNCLLVAASNDWKSFLVKNGRLLSLLPHSVDIWANLTSSQKINYNCRNLNLLSPDSRTFLSLKLEEYKEALSVIFQNSTVTKVFHSSVLERFYPGCENLDLYFAVLNSYLHKALNKLNSSKPIFNKKGEKIKWMFINVSDQFHNSPNPIHLFREDEQITGVMTHRHDDAISEIVLKYSNFIKKDLFKE